MTRHRTFRDAVEAHDADRICPIDGCTRLVDSHGLCGCHSLRQTKHGSPHISLIERGGPEAQLARYTAREPNGCIVWTGGRTESGRGRISIHHGTRFAHRVAWELAHGPIPPGLFICHHCDNPPCVNVDHLFLGTHQDNMADMVRKGRSYKGGRQLGRWSRKHDACIECGTTALRHAGFGRCETCRQRWRRAKS